eukprot:TRINITY_DN2633_c0_g1_i1.p1 TRINITY_DN2633_c0_g1~~TRINITY_DN2633_c0_g1_i1.p1  ORF type:complete len:373 (+),score=68.26 TRINITY_DN2633_c0_g1_i1:88-1206(+)
MESFESTFHCPTCDRDIHVLLLPKHIPKCYRELLVFRGLQVYCTCCDDDICAKGLLPNNKNQPVAVPPRFHPYLGASPMGLVQPYPFEHFHENPIEQVQLESAQLTGKHCMLLHSNTSKKSVASTGLPGIHIGKHRCLQICLKHHLRNPSDVDAMIKVIQKEVDFINQNGDSVVDTPLLRSSGGIPNSNEAIEGENLAICAGYVTEQEKEFVECKKECRKLVWISVNETPQYFCNGLHALRYVSKHYSKGVASDEAKRIKAVAKEKKKEATKQKKTKEKEEQKKKKEEEKNTGRKRKSSPAKKKARKKQKQTENNDNSEDEVETENDDEFQLKNNGKNDPKPTRKLRSTKQNQSQDSNLEIVNETTTEDGTN